ncbi:MAG: F0F1 ATP synthase subunit B [Pseudomonadota bacterium]|nr:F0F1 ATP synthase subunit B [Pseudomonadota bacterium]
MNINATLFAEMVVFVFFVTLTRVYIWPPLIDIIEKRQSDIAQGVEDAKAGTQLLRESEAQKKDILEDAKLQASGIIDQAESTAQGIIQDAEAKAKQLQEAQVAAAQLEINKQTLIAKKALEENTLAYISQLLVKIIGETPDMQHLEQMVKKAAGEVHE